MLSDSQLAGFRKVLEQEQINLRERLQTSDRRLARDVNYNEAEDWGDSATQVLTKEEFLFEHNQVIDRLGEIERALQRIEIGSYGISKVSGKPIPVERLKAMPTATTLVGERLIP
jgi:RNA polymerase-binding transcription factor DksA